MPFGEAGEGGEAGEAAGGKAGTGGKGGSGGTGGTAVVTPEGGAAGETPVGAAGEGGAPVAEGGAAGATVGGAPSEGGAGGALAMCTPTGTTSNLNLNEGSLKVCRGAIVSTNFNASDSPTSFTCCGTGNFDVAMQGVTVNTGDGNFGNLAFLVPADAPLGVSDLTTTCDGSISSNPFSVDVQTTLPPIVQGLEESSIFSGDTLMVDGTNLAGVTSIEAVSTLDGSAYICNIGADQALFADVQCTFDSIPPGDYVVIVEQTDCGAATFQPPLTIKQPT